jgi:hypothetical protein
MDIKIVRSIMHACIILHVYVEGTKLARCVHLSIQGNNVHFDKLLYVTKFGA